jgi:CMP-N,N'-diacetyllegionaminic acid synthase
MYNGKRIIAVIPARGGSKTVPRKNIKLLAGKPLIAWSIEAGKSVDEIDRVIVSTDDDLVRTVALEHGAEVYRRPANLATDEALVIDALRDLIVTLRREGEQAQFMVLLEPTSPLRTVGDIRQCLERLVEGGKHSVATFKRADLNPHRAWRIRDGRPEVFIPGAVPWLPRQKLPEAFQLNGAVYAFRIDHLLQDSPSLLVGEVGVVLMPSERSVDIDDDLDFEIAEAIVRKLRIGGVHAEKHS